MLLGPIYALVVYWSHYVQATPGEFPWYFYVATLMAYAIHQVNRVAPPDQGEHSPASQSLSLHCGDILPTITSPPWFQKIVKITESIPGMWIIPLGVVFHCHRLESKS